LIDSTTQTITGTKYFTGKLHGGYGASTGAAALEIDAAKTNPFRMLNSIGELENYIKGMNAIHKR
jgi:hypothetical protein